MNKVILTGRTIKDIELNQTKNNKEYTRFTLAVTRDMKNQLGEYETDFINCVAYNNIAKMLANYVLKGDKIGVEGRINTSNYEKDGKKIYSTEILIEKIEFLSQRKNTIKEEITTQKSIESVNFDDIDVSDDLPF